MTPKHEEYAFKIVVTGDGGVGKTSLIVRLTENRFSEDYKMTLGTSFAAHTLNVGDSIVTLQVWDLGGQPSFSHLRSFFYQGSKGGIIVFDLTDAKSFKNVSTWQKDLFNVCGEVPIVLIGNKNDLASERVVSQQEAERLARSLGAPYIETSAKTGDKVSAAFQSIARRLLGIEEKPSLVTKGVVVPEIKSKIGKFIDQRREYLLNLLGDLISARSINPPGNEKLAANVVQGELYRIGLHTETYEKESGRTNLVGWIDKGASPSLMIITHLDVVPSGDGWIYDPFKATPTDGRIAGRGSVDDKGPIASVLLALHALKEYNFPIRGRLMFVAVADEETGSELGMKYLLNEKELTTDYALVAEQTKCKSIEIAEKGRLWVKLKSTGTQGHGSMPEKGTNAIVNLSKVIARLENLRMEYVEHPLFNTPTINVGTIQGGISPNMVPAFAEAKVDIRYLPSQEPKQIVNELRELVKSVKRENPELEVTIEPIASDPPTEVSPEDPVVRVLGNVVQEVVGSQPKLIGIGGATVAKYCILRGIPTAVFGPGDIKEAHATNESVSVEELLTAAKVYALTILNLLS
jgi:acetylornithine deacetylase/succinyl-diaminopimelate desuccinylase family protein